MNILDIFYIILCVLAFLYELFDLFRYKYEVFGIIVDNERGATGVNEKYFRTYKNAMNCYKEYENKYFSVCMNRL